MSLAEDLKALDCGEVDGSDDTRKFYSHDASVFELVPEVVVSPRNAADVEKVVGYAGSHPGVSIVGRSAGTDMGGGAIGTSIILDFTKHINTLGDIARDTSVAGQDGYAITEPGVFYRDFERATMANNLIMPSFPGSKDLCALGGMVSNNAGGERSLKYGQTVNFVRSVNAVCSDGKQYSFGQLDAVGLEKKKSQQDFEGELYRKMHSLVSTHWETIQAHKPKVSKNSSGYFLWRIWDPHTGAFNLSQLLCGSQGTLAMLTQATIGLVQPPSKRKMVIAFLHDLKHVADAVDDLLELKPETLESFDDKTLTFTLRFLGDFVRLMGAGGILSLAWQFLPEAWMALRGGLPKLIVICEFTGEDQAELDAKAAKAVEVLKTYPGITARPAKDEAEAHKYWVIRRSSFQVIRAHATGKRSTPFIDDFIIPPRSMPQFLPELNQILDPYKLTLTISGHVGNGNFHIIPLMDLRDPKTHELIPEISEKVYRLVLRYGGSITAEHNDGLIRGAYVEEMWGPQMYELFKETKRIWDPKNIFNPGKKINVNWKWALDHLRKD